MLSMKSGLPALLLGGCLLSHHELEVSTIGVPHGSAEMEALIDAPGPIIVETIHAADWSVSLAGLLDLSDPKAKAAGLVDRLEPIQIYAFGIRHPTKGLYVIDTGVSNILRDHPEEAASRGIVAKYMHLERLKVDLTLGDWLKGQPLAGVFLTHLHFDHITGMEDVPAGTPIWVGPGEARARSGQNIVVRRPTDRALKEAGPLRSWGFKPEPTGPIPGGVVDVFGDGSFWALSTPGHTAGSTAYLARTAEGPILFTGDTSHTRWGWDNEVPPGKFTGDIEKNRASLHALRRLADAHPAMQVKLGHQP